MNHFIGIEQKTENAFLEQLIIDIHKTQNSGLYEFFVPLGFNCNFPEDALSLFDVYPNLLNKIEQLGYVVKPREFESIGGVKKTIKNGIIIVNNN